MVKLSSIAMLMHFATADSNDVHSSLRHARVTPISPALDPTSSKKFFTKDYPADGRPDVKGLKKHGFHDFTPPFPAVQDQDNFDKDYVKDENRDNGEWQAQANYDKLKLEWRKVKDALAKAKAEEDAKKSEADAAGTKAHEAQGKNAEATAKAQQKAKWRAELEAEEKAAEEKAAGERAGAANATKHEVSKTGVEAAQMALQREQEQFKKCQEELEAAKAHLKNVQDALIAKKAAQVQADAAAKDEAEKAAIAAEGEEAKLAENIKKDEADSAAADKAAADADKTNAVVQKDADAKKSSYERDQMTVAEAKAALGKAEEELAKAEHKLKMFRGELAPADATQGEHSSNPIRNLIGSLVSKLR